MRKIVLMAAMIAGSNPLWSQNQSGFETVKSENKDEVIYKGPCTFEDIAEVKIFDLEKKAGQYKADPQKIEVLADKLGDYQMVIFLGTWCEDSHRLIPELYRVLKDTDYPMEELQLYALDRQKHGKDGEEKAYGITNVPTIILLKDGAEKGRITETVAKSIESDLLQIIEKE